MGIGASKPIRPGLILSFDALGTLYRFRAPVANQYLTIAQQCGLKSIVELPELEASFRRAYKAVNAEFPNYGKGKLDNPEAWWTELVKRSFKEVVREEDLPPNLGSAMYQHFSSGAAYELYPDVKPLLQWTQQLRKDPDSPILMLGIITNSDPRVKSVLESQSFKIGLTERPQYDMNSIREATDRSIEGYKQTGTHTLRLPWDRDWDPANDFDFLTTSYDADFEKPHAEVFNYTRRLVRGLAMSKTSQDAWQGKQGVGRVIGVINVIKAMREAEEIMDNLRWIHIGDDYNKDCNLTEVPFDIQTLHLVREGEGKPVEGANTITSLTEVASIINLTMRDLD